MKKKNTDLSSSLKPLQSDHRLVTRRDFLAQGLVGMSAQVLTPGLFSLLKTHQASAQDIICSGGFDQVEGKTPIVMIDLAGGGNIPGSNVLVGGQSGQHDFLNSYQRLGLPSNFNPQNSLVNNEYGLQFHSMSAMLGGMNSVTSISTRQKCEGGIFCATSADDTGNNPHNPVYWLNKAGARGDVVQTIGTRGGQSGGRSTIPTMSYDPTISPMQITRPEDAVELVSLGRVHNLFSNSQAEKILKTMQNMSESKLISFSRRSLPEQVREVVRCGFAKSAIDQRVHNTDSRFSQNSLNPRLDNDINAVYDDLADGNQRREASVAKLVLDGYAGTGTVTLGGYDYHNRPRSQTEQRDFRAGQAIGRVLELASRKQKDVVIYVFTDGGISTRRTAPEANDPGANGKLMFTSDDSQRTAAFMLVYRHSARPELRHRGNSFSTHRRQIGHFTPDQNVMRNANLISNNVVNLAKAVVLNYLALHGEESKIADIVGDNPFGSDLENYLFFDRLS